MKQLITFASFAIVACSQIPSKDDKSGDTSLEKELQLQSLRMAADEAEAAQTALRANDLMSACIHFTAAKEYALQAKVDDASYKQAVETTQTVCNAAAKRGY